MCGRFALTASSEELTRHFQLKTNIFMKPRYNISPQEMVPVSRKIGEMDFLRWGFLPLFKAEQPGERGFINIRAETVAEKPSFRQSLWKGRCLIPANGYYEWKSLGRTKQPFYIQRKDAALFALAALWEGDTFGVITVPSNSLLMPIHHRMPVILPMMSYVEWMDHKTPLEKIKTLLMPLASETLQVYPVTPKMNKAGFEGPVCIQSLQ